MSEIYIFLSVRTIDPWIDGVMFLEREGSREGLKCCFRNESKNIISVVQNNWKGHILYRYFNHTHLRNQKERESIWPSVYNCSLLIHTCFSTEMV